MKVNAKVFADDFFQSDNSIVPDNTNMPSQVQGDNPNQVVINAPDGSKTIVKRIAPNKFVLLKFGKVDYSVNGKQDSFDFTPEMAQQLIQEFKNRGKDLVMDWDHSTLDGEEAAKGNAEAAAWIGGFEITPDGLVANVKSWTDKAKDQLERGAYRYFSPVINFDDDGKCPTGIQSIGLTNHPAIHGLEALVAANDTKKDVNVKIPELVQKYKKTIAETKGGIESLNDGLNDLLKGYSEVIAGNEELKKDMIAFNDSLHIKLADGDGNIVAPLPGEDMVEQPIAPVMIPTPEQTTGVNPSAQAVESADINSLIMQKRNELSGDEMLAWVDNQLNTSTSAAAKNILNAEKNRLLSFKEQNPDLWNSGVHAANPATITYLKNAQQNVIPTSDIAPLFNVQTKEGITAGIKVFADVARQAQVFLKMHDVKSFDDFNKKIKNTEKAFSDKIKKLETDIQMKKINDIVIQAMNDGKMTEAQKPSAIEMGKKDFKVFCDFIDKQPKQGLLSRNMIQEFADDADKDFVNPERRLLLSDDALNIAAKCGDDTGAELKKYLADNKLRTL